MKNTSVTGQELSSLLLFIIYSQNYLLAYLDNVLNGFFKYLITITEFKIKCLTDRGLTKCYSTGWSEK